MAGRDGHSTNPQGDQKWQTQKEVIDDLSKKLRSLRAPVSDLLESKITGVLVDLLGSEQRPQMRLCHCRALLLITRILKDAMKKYPTSGNTIANQVNGLFKLSMVSVLVECLRSDDADLIHLASSTLLNIASMTKALASLVWHSSLALRILDVLAKKIQAKYTHNLTSLMKHLHDIRDQDAVGFRPTIIWMFVRMFKAKHRDANPQLLPRLLPLIVQVLQVIRTSSLLTKACQLLIYLTADGDPQRTMQVVNSGACGPLCNMVVHDNRYVAANALRCVRLIAQGGPVQRQTVVDAGVFGKVRSLFHESDGSAVEEALIVARILITDADIHMALMPEILQDSEILKRLILHDSAAVQNAANDFYNQCLQPRM